MTLLIIFLPIFLLKKSGRARRLQNALKQLGAKCGYSGAVAGGDFCWATGSGCGCGVTEVSALIAWTVLAFLKAVLLDGWKTTGAHGQRQPHPILCVNCLRAPS